jgi:hypothetical protein
VVSPARPSQTLAADSYGRSVRSGQRIPDERLEADPLAELTIEEAATAERDTVEEEGDDAVGLVSAGHPFEVLAEADITRGGAGRRGGLRRAYRESPDQRGISLMLVVAS